MFLRTCFEGISCSTDGSSTASIPFCCPMSPRWIEAKSREVQGVFLVLLKNPPAGKPRRGLWIAPVAGGGWWPPSVVLKRSGFRNRATNFLGILVVVLPFSWGFWWFYIFFGILVVLLEFWLMVFKHSAFLLRRGSEPANVPSGHDWSCGDLLRQSSNPSKRRRGWVVAKDLGCLVQMV